jgi:hypothetical protein
VDGWIENGFQKVAVVHRTKLIVMGSLVSRISFTAVITFNYYDKMSARPRRKARASAAEYGSFEPWFEKLWDNYASFGN